MNIWLLKIRLHSVDQSITKLQPAVGFEARLFHTMKKKWGTEKRATHTVFSTENQVKRVWFLVIQRGLGDFGKSIWTLSFFILFL